MIHVWKKNSHYRSYRYKWETSQKRKLVGRMHSVGRVLSFIFSRQNCFFPTPHPQSNVSRAKGKRGRDTFASEWGGGSYWKRLSFDEGIYTVVLYFYMYYVLIWAKRENRRWGWMIMIHVPRHHNIELIAKYRTVAESVLCEGCVVWRHAAHHTQIRWFVRLRKNELYRVTYILCKWNLSNFGGRTTCKLFGKDKTAENPPNRIFSVRCSLQ
jgi:hypothetical protein